MDTADGLVSGDFDLGEILEGAVFSVVSKALVAGINLDTTFNIDTSGLGDIIPGFGSGQLSWGELLENGLDGVISSGLSIAVYGTDFGEGVLSSIVSYVANGVAGAAIEEVADIYGHDVFSVEKLVAKATINCLAAEAKGASCASGALGSLVAETLSVMAVSGDEPLSADDLDRLEKNIELISAIAGFFASGGEAENVYATNVAAQLDHENNWIWFAIRAGVFAWTVYEVVDAAVALNGEFDRLYGDGELTEAEARELQEAAAAVGINIAFEVTAGKVVKGMRIVSVAGDFSLAVAKKLGLDKVLADLNKKMSGVGAANTTATIGGKTCVYSCVVDGTARYVGITDDVARRGREHLTQKGIEIEGILGLNNLSRADARAVEQALIHTYGLGKDGGTLINKINSISPTKNPTAYEQSLQRGFELLESVDCQWTF